MYKYVFFIIFGILLYLFLNGVERFSVGIPVTDLNQIFPDSDDKITTDIDPYGTGIPRIFWNQGLRLRERFEPRRLYDVGWYYGNDSGRIFISAINIPILETTGTTGRPATAEVPTPTYINYNMYRYHRELVINGITYYIGTAGRDIIGQYRLYNQDNALIIIDLNNNIVVDEPLDLLQLEPDHPPPQSATGGTAGGGACSVVTSVSNLKVRVGFEIETCFSNKPGQRRGIAGNYTICNFTNSDGSIIVPDEYGNIVQFLTTTRADDSLFKGIFEMTGQCKSENDCNVELIINNDKHVFFDGNNFSVDESEFKTSIQDWLDNNITSCGNIFNEEPSGPNPRDNKLLSTCSVHLHISVPSLETKYKDLFKILVFYLWFTEYQDMLKSKNPNYVTVGKRYSSPYKSLSEIDFPLPDASQITTMVSDPDSNRDMIQTFVNTLPGQIRDDSGHSRGTLKSNVIIVNTKFGDLYPHFEFRGHYDLMKSISSPNPTADLVYEHLKNYTHSIWEVLNEAHNMLK